MTVRHSLMAACLAATALVPFTARANDLPAGRTGELAKKLSDPATQIAVTAVLSTLAQSVLDMDIAPVARAMRSAGVPSDMPDDARVSDVAGPDAARVPQDIARNAPRAMTAMAGMAGAVEDMLPELRAMAARLRTAIPRD